MAEEAGRIPSKPCSIMEGALDSRCGENDGGCGSREGDVGSHRTGIGGLDSGCDGKDAGRGQKGLWIHIPVGTGETRGGCGQWPRGFGGVCGAKLVDQMLSSRFAPKLLAAPPERRGR